MSGGSTTGFSTISPLQQQKPSGSKKNLRALQCVHGGTSGKTILSPFGKMEPGFLRTRSDVAAKYHSKLINIQISQIYESKKMK